MLEKIQLRGFKSFHDAEVPLGRLTLIVGANASGKSNLRDALRFLHGVGQGYALAEILGEKYGPGGVLVWKGIRGGAREVATHGRQQFSVGCEMRRSEQPAIDYSLTVDVSDITAGPRVVDESLRRRDDGSIHDVWHINGHLKDALRVRSFGNTADREGLTVFGSKRPILSQMTEQDRPGDAPSASAAVSETLRSMRFLDLDPEAMRQPSQPGQVILGDRGENLSSVLQSICSDPALEQTLLSWVRALTPMDAVELGFEHDFAGRVMVYLVESSGARVSALSASDGTLRFLALVAALLSPTAASSTSSRNSTTASTPPACTCCCSSCSRRASGRRSRSWARPTTRPCWPSSTRTPAITRCWCIAPRPAGASGDRGGAAGRTQ